MRILICTGIFPPEAGGPATYTANLAAALVDRGHHIAVVTYAENQKIRKSDYPIYPIVRSWFKPLHYWKYFQTVKRLGKNFDVIFAQDPVSAGYPAYLAAKVLKKPFVVKITGDYSWEQAMGHRAADVLIDEFQKLPRYPRWISLMRRIQVHVTKEAQYVIVPGEYLKRLVMGWGVKEKKMRVIYNAAPATPDLPRPAHDGFRVLSVGRDVPWKGFAVLRQAAEELKTQIPDLSLEVLHSEPRQKVLERLAVSDIFVLNSGYEGISHVTLEAMALGTPVVASRAGGNPEVVYDGENGLLVDYNDKEQLKAAIKKFYDDPGLREKLAAAAKERLKKFTTEAMINQTEGVLQQCAS